MSRTAEETKDTARKIEAAGGVALALDAEISDAESMKRTVGRLVEIYGRLDAAFAPIDESQPAERDGAVDVNLRGTYLTPHFAAPHLKRAGGEASLVGRRRFRRSPKAPSRIGISR